MAAYDSADQNAVIGRRGKKLIIAVEVAAARKAFDCDNCPYGKNAAGHFCTEANPAPTHQWGIKWQTPKRIEADYNFDKLPPPKERPLYYWVGHNGAAKEFHSRICLLPMVTAEAGWLLRMWPHWEGGKFALPGALLDQPYGYVQAMEFIGVARGNLKRE